MPAILEDLTAELIVALAERGERRTLGGFGIKTADAYVKGVVSCADDEVCRKIVLPNGFTWEPAEMLKLASERLVYSNENMVLEEVVKEADADELAKANGVKLPPRTLMVFENWITTPLRDRDGDVLRSEGAVIDKAMPLLWHHMPPMPAGKMLKVLSQDKKGVKVLTALIDSELGGDAAALIEFGALRISHGFRPLEYEPMKDGGYDVTKFEIMEESLVTVPSNTEAIITAFSRDKLHDPLVKSWAKSISDVRPVQVSGFTPQAIEVERWNRSLSKSFDVVREHLEASRLEYDWVSRWAGCQIKELYQSSQFVPSFRMGSWLTGLRHATSNWKLEDTRAITYDGKEVPPQYEVIQLNSKVTDTFMVEGILFYKGHCCISIKLERSYNGLVATLYSALKDATRAAQVFDDSWRFAIANNFLKGEAFSLSGDFIQRTGEQWDDVFLSDRNTKALRTAVQQINRKARAAPNRGMILMGDPGTGKTLSGRIIRNTAEATFVWISSRDFYYSGAFRGMMEAFDLARELSPCILFIEDIDNWMSDHTCDLLKTEMDGIGRSSGIFTVLTTNYPERLPKALIDRPGRFHDVLMFDLPNEAIRRRMLESWLPECSAATIVKAARSTDGYSGAHLYELSQYAKSISEADEIEIDKAVDLAIEKIREQRELITQAQLQGSNYRPSKNLLKALEITRKETDCCDEDEELKGEKPYPNEHACRLRSPDDFEPGSFRRTSREHEGKKYDVIMGKLRGETKMTEQAYRYPKDEWTVAEARKHCKDNDGRTFEPATDEDGDDEDAFMPEPKADNAATMTLGTSYPVQVTVMELVDESLTASKSGRVLSAKNKNKLIKAAELLGEVIASSEVQGDGEDKRSMTADVLKWLDAGAPQDEIKALHELLGREIARHARAKRSDRVRRLLRSKR